MPLVVANRYRVAGRPHFRIVVDFGGASLESCCADSWKLEAAARTLDDLLTAPQLAGVKLADLIAETQE